MPGVWIGMEDNTARQIKKIWAGKGESGAQEIRAGWVGIDGKAKKIWPRYIKHFHVADGDPSTGNRDGDDDVSSNFSNYGYGDLSDTVASEVNAHYGGCFRGSGYHEHDGNCAIGYGCQYRASFTPGYYKGDGKCPDCGSGLWINESDGSIYCSNTTKPYYDCGNPINRWRTSCGYTYGQTIEGND